MATVANLGNDVEDKDKLETQEPVASGQESATVSASSTGPAAPGAKPAQQGSGQFTNLNKYLEANKGAGQQIGANIQQGIQKDIGGQQKKAETQAEAFKSGVTAAQGNVNQGVGYLNQLGGSTSGFAPGAVPQAGANVSGQQAPAAPVPNVPGSPTVPALPSWLQGAPQQKMSYDEMMALANDQSKLGQLTGLRTGATQQADIAGLQTQQQSAADAAAAANQRLADRQSQLGNAQNRYGLLNEFVGQKGTYGAGNQLLDQSFLQRDKSNVLGSLMKNLNQQKDTTFKGLTSNVNDLSNKALETGNIGQQLAAALDKQTKGNASGLISDISGQVGNVNAQRAAEQQRYKDFVDQLMGKKTGNFDPNLFNEFGLIENQQTFNVMDPSKNMNLTPEQLIKLSAQRANTYGDIATQKDVDIYGALSKLAGIDPSALTKAGNLEKAAGVSTGENSLANQLARASQQFYDQSKDKVLTGHGQEDYYNNNLLGNWGGSSTAYATSDANLNDLLKNEYNLNNQTGVANVRLGSGGVSPFINPISGILDAGRTIFGGGNKSGAEGGATIKAQQDLANQINQYFRQSGYGNMLTMGGVKDTSNIREAAIGNLQQQAQLRQDLSKYGLDQNADYDQIYAQANRAAEEAQDTAWRNYTNSPHGSGGVGGNNYDFDFDSTRKNLLIDLLGKKSQIDSLKNQTGQYTQDIDNLLKRPAGVAAPSAAAPQAPVKSYAELAQQMRGQGASGAPADVSTGNLASNASSPIMSYAQAVAAAQAKKAAK